jgi:hypothetical protein
MLVFLRCRFQGAGGGLSSCEMKLKNKKRIPFFKNEPEKLLITNDRGQKTNRNEPENEAEKLLKIRTCGKNEPETKRKTNLAILLKIK